MCYTGCDHAESDSASSVDSHLLCKVFRGGYKTEKMNILSAARLTCKAAETTSFTSPPYGNRAEQTWQ